jgi:hypothetical protein
VRQKPGQVARIGQLRRAWEQAHCGARRYTIAPAINASEDSGVKEVPIFFDNAFYQD